MADNYEQAPCTSPWINPSIFDAFLEPATALSICALCPVRLWCLKLVEPASSHYDGIAGGHVWREGKLQDGHTDKEEPILQIYMRNRRPRARNQHTMIKDTP